MSSLKDTLSHFTGARERSVASAKDAMAALVALREERATTERTLDAVRHAPPPEAEFAANIDGVVDGLSTFWVEESGRGLLLMLSGQQNTMELNGRTVTTPSRPALPWNPTQPMPLSAFAFFFGDQLKQALKAGVARLVAQGLVGEPGLPVRERAARVAALEHDLAELEAAEEGAVDQMAAAGLHVEHRPEVRARREAEARALEEAQRKQREADWIEEARKHGQLGHRARVNPNNFGGMGRR